MTPSAAGPFGAVLGALVRAQFERDGILVDDEAAKVDWRAVGERLKLELGAVMLNPATGHSSTGELRDRIEKALG